MKTAISIPDALFDAAEKLAKQSSMSRSELYAKAVAAFVREHSEKDVTKRLNTVYETEDSRVDRVAETLQHFARPRGEW